MITRRRQVRLQGLLVVGLLAIAVFFHLVWLGALDVWRIDRDWRGFFHAGELLLAGERAAIYLPRAEGEYPAAFVYPPPMLWPFMGLAWLGAPTAYATITATSVLLLVLILRWLRELLDAPTRTTLLIALVTVASAPWMTMLFVGQLSMVATALFVFGFVAWQRGHEFSAGIAFGAMLCKPTLAFAAPLLALLRGRWRILQGLAATAAVLVVVSLPLGVDLWGDWLGATATLSARLRDHTMLWKHTTLYAFWRSALGAGVETSLVRAVWWSGAVLLVSLPCILVLRRPQLPISRLMTLAALLTVTVTPYLFYYDQLLLLPAGAAWYLGRANYQRSRCWHLAGGALAASCLAHYASLYVARDLPPLAGLCNTVWFGAELWDVSASKA